MAEDSISGVINKVAEAMRRDPVVAKGVAEAIAVGYGVKPGTLTETPPASDDAINASMRRNPGESMLDYMNRMNQNTTVSAGRRSS